LTFMAGKRKTPEERMAAASLSGSDSDSDDAPEAVSSLAAREATRAQSRAEEQGRHGVNQKNKERHKRQNDRLQKQAEKSKRRLKKQALLPPELLAQLGSEEPKPEPVAIGGGVGNVPLPDEETEEWVELGEDMEDGPANNIGLGMGGDGRHNRKTFSSDSDSDGDGEADADDEGPEPSEGVRAVALRQPNRAALPPTSAGGPAATFRQRRLHAGAVARANAVALRSRRRKGPAAVFA
jgi:hypothetical protein